MCLRINNPPNHPHLYRFQFYKLINKISNADIVDGARDFRLMNHKMVEAVVSMGEYNRFSKGIFGWIVMGQYVARIYIETKHRPHYIIAETNGEDVIKIK